MKRIRWLAGYCLYLLVVVVLVDVLVLNKIMGLGYPRHYEEENIFRYPAPYVAFAGKAGAANHTEHGVPGPSFAGANPGDLKIAFFGGSTGYAGEPPIPTVVETELEELMQEGVFVSNYSVVSSNHRQHLHGLIEFLPGQKPDIVIFYGGYNEIIQSAFYDPRPGYPFNHFYRAETKPFVKLLLENSAVIGEVDKAFGSFSGLGRLRNEQKPFSEDWNDRIADKYLETLALARKTAGTMDSGRFGATKFLAFYQPYRVPDRFAAKHEEVKARIDAIPYIYDVSSEYESMGEDVYTDVVHVRQEAREKMGRAIASNVFRALQQEGVKPGEGNQ